MNGHCRLHSSALHEYKCIWHLRIRASSLQFRASKINMALVRMDKLVKKLMSNPVINKYSVTKYFFIICFENLHLGISSTHTYQIHSIDMCRP
jgi:hypothetical protein